MRSTATITVRSHGFTISNFNDDFYKYVSAYCRKFVQNKMASVVQNGRRITKQVPDRVFGSATSDRKQVRLHINCMKEFYSFMQNYGYNTSRFKIVNEKPSEGVDVDFEFVNKDIAPLPHQVEYIKYQLDKNPNGPTTKINSLQTGKGKAVQLDTPLKTPTGWKLMRDIKLGDEVIAWDGSPTKVTGVYPQPIKQMYNVAFADGRSMEVCGEHLWEVYYVNTVKHKRWRVVDTLEVLRLISMPNPRVYVRLAENIEEPVVDHFIHPYALGALIGDGYFVDSTITITKPDEDFITNFVNYLPPTMTFSRYNDITIGLIKKPKILGPNPWTEELKRLGLHGKHSYEKFIPDEYMTGSRRQRLAIVQGLLDTDGTVQKSGSVSFNTSSPKLAEQMQYLIRSLGGIAAINSRIPTYTYKGEKLEGRRTYDVDIRHKKPTELFTMERKRARCNDNGQYNEGLKLRVSSITPTKMGESQCISVDHPDKLFVCKDFIVTHNTFCAIYNMVQLKKRTVIVLMPKYINTWLTALSDFVKHTPQDIMVLQGADDYNGCCRLAREGKLDAKIIIVSLPTYQYCMANYEDTNGEMSSYDASPDEFWSLVDAGFLIVDEGHESIHALFKTDLYTNIQNKLILSATLEADDEFVNDMYAVIYPFNMRFKNGEYDKYISSTALMFGLANVKKVKFKGFGGTYSHVKLEQSIIKDKKLLWSYLEFWRMIYELTFIKKKVDSQRCLIYAATVEMCLLLANHLQEFYPDLVINKFTQEDPKESLYESDTAVSTLKSASTGVDIQDLLVVICTVAVGSRQQSNQSLGRLRRLKRYPDTTPNYYYGVCTGIKQHVDYHHRKIKTFANKTLSQREVNTGYSL